MANSTAHPLCGMHAIIDGHIKVFRTTCGVPFPVDDGAEVCNIHRLCPESHVRGNHNGHCVFHTAKHKVEGLTNEEDDSGELAAGDELATAQPSTDEAGMHGRISSSSTITRVPPLLSISQLAISALCHRTRAASRQDCFKGFVPIKIYAVQRAAADFATLLYHVRWAPPPKGPSSRNISSRNIS